MTLKKNEFPSLCKVKEQGSDSIAKILQEHGKFLKSYNSTPLFQEKNKFESPFQLNEEGNLPQWHLHKVSCNEPATSKMKVKRKVRKNISYLKPLSLTQLKIRQREK